MVKVIQDHSSSTVKLIFLTLFQHIWIIWSLVHKMSQGQGHPRALKVKGQIDIFWPCFNIYWLYDPMVHKISQGQGHPRPLTVKCQSGILTIFQHVLAIWPFLCNKLVKVKVIKCHPRSNVKLRFFNHISTYNDYMTSWCIKSVKDKVIQSTDCLVWEWILITSSDCGKPRGITCYRHDLVGMSTGLKMQVSGPHTLHVWSR